MSNNQKLATYFGKPGRQSAVFAGNRKPLLFVLLLLCVVAVLVGFSFSSRLKPKTIAASAKQDVAPVDTQALFGRTSDEDLLALSMATEEKKHAEPELDMVQAPEPMDLFEQRMRAEEQRLLAQQEAERLAAEKAALQSSITAYTNPDYEKVLPKIQRPEKETLSARIENSKLLSENYLATTRIKPISPYEVKAGSVIPAVMLSGINSDLPGQILAQVSENVYDTASGKYLMIPQGSRLVGQYLNKVNTGQDRVMVTWQRIIYPDGSSLNIENMQGVDPSGYSGFEDKTDNHYKATFGQALLLSIFSAGAQLAQPIPKAGSLAYTPQQVAAGSVSQQMAQYGMASMNRGMNIPPTITIRPGYRFNIMVNKDIVMEPWRTQEHPLQAASIGKRG